VADNIAYIFMLLLSHCKFYSQGSQNSRFELLTTEPEAMAPVLTPLAQAQFLPLHTLPVSSCKIHYATIFYLNKYAATYSFIAMK